MSLKRFNDDLLSWDGRSADQINEIYDRQITDTQFIEHLLNSLETTAFQSGATWLLKEYLTNKQKLDTHQVSRVFKAARQLQGWQARLHLLQSISYLVIGKKEKGTVKCFLRDCLQDPNKFVRAWAYSGFYELALQYPEYQREALHFMQLASTDESASAQARIRQIRKSDAAFFTNNLDTE
ncbi:MAG: hypothetical protein P1U80_07545 [Pseudomonadales bacterium]|nr:hypothetical protein [Pseudomonadales bacterium]